MNYATRFDLDNHFRCQQADLGRARDYVLGIDTAPPGSQPDSVVDWPGLCAGLITAVADDTVGATNNMGGDSWCSNAQTEGPAQSQLSVIDLEGCGGRCHTQASCYTLGLNS